MHTYVYIHTHIHTHTRKHTQAMHTCTLRIHPHVYGTYAEQFHPYGTILILTEQYIHSHVYRTYAEQFHVLN
jgi:hypothetical protein